MILPLNPRILIELQVMEYKGILARKYSINS